MKLNVAYSSGFFFPVFLQGPHNALARTLSLQRGSQCNAEILESPDRQDIVHSFQIFLVV